MIEFLVIVALATVLALCADRGFKRAQEAGRALGEEGE